MMMMMMMMMMMTTTTTMIVMVVVDEIKIAYAYQILAAEIRKEQTTSDKEVKMGE
jgi:hypothetical protein